MDSGGVPFGMQLELIELQYITSAETGLSIENKLNLCQLLQKEEAFLNTLQNPHNPILM